MTRAWAASGGPVRRGAVRHAGVAGRAAAGEPLRPERGNHPAGPQMSGQDKRNLVRAVSITIVVGLLLFRAGDWVYGIGLSFLDARY